MQVSLYSPTASFPVTKSLLPKRAFIPPAQEVIPRFGKEGALEKQPPVSKRSTPFYKPEPDPELIQQSSAFFKETLENAFRTTIDFPKSERDKLHRLIQSGKRVQVAMHHAEVMTDWLLPLSLRDKFPKIAGWLHVNYFVRPIRPLLSHLNMIPSAPAKEALAFTKEYLSNGGQSGIFPAGHVFYTSDHIPSFAEGVINMAFDMKGVILPTVWKYRFTEDASEGLHQELDFIESNLNLPSTQNGSVPVNERFFQFQKNLLEARRKKVEGVLPESLKTTPITDENFFDLQEEIFHRLITMLEWRYQDALEREYRGKYKQGQLLETGLSPHRRAWRLEKIIDRNKPSGILSWLGFNQNKEVSQDQELLKTAYVMAESFSKDWYNTKTISQEHIAESLKRVIKQEFSNESLPTMLRRTASLDTHLKVPRQLIEGRISRLVLLVLDSYNKYWLRNASNERVSIPLSIKDFPVPVGKRQAHLRFAEPIDVQALWEKDLKRKRPLSEDEFKANLMQQLRDAMQKKLDEINQSYPLLVQYSNPFYNSSSKTQAA